MIIPKFHFFQIQRKLFFGDAMKVGQPLFGVTPEPFQAVDVHLSGRKGFAVIDPQVAVAAKHQTVIAAELVGIDEAAATDGLDRLFQQAPGGNILDHLHANHAVSLVNAEYRHFRGRSPAPLALASAAKVRLVQLDFPGQKIGGIRSRGQNRIAQQVVRLQGRRITDSTLNRRPKGADLQFKHLDQPQPGFERAVELVDPPSGKIMKGVFASFAAVSFARQTVHSAPLTDRTKNPTVSVTGSSKIQTGSMFRKNQSFKVLRSHGHQYNPRYLVQIVL
jgi:hypothetical protein